MSFERRHLNVFSINFQFFLRVLKLNFEPVTFGTFAHFNFMGNAISTHAFKMKSILDIIAQKENKIQTPLNIK